MSAPTYKSLWPIYAGKWDTMIPVTSAKAAEILSVATRLLKSKARYQSVETETRVPWAMIAVIHERESGQDWKASLAQGDRWDRKSTHVPKGRGPFNSWEDAAIDALEIDGLDKVKDWRLEKVLYNLELYNGWGYHNHGVPSPYLWAGSNEYTRGKYTADGKWSPTTVDKQLGCAPLLMRMMNADKSIKFIRET